MIYRSHDGGRQELPDRDGCGGGSLTSKIVSREWCRQTREREEGAICWAILGDKMKSLFVNIVEPFLFSRIKLKS